MPCSESAAHLLLPVLGGAPKQTFDPDSDTDPDADLLPSSVGSAISVVRFSRLRAGCPRSGPPTSAFMTFMRFMVRFFLLLSAPLRLRARIPCR